MFVLTNLSLILKGSLILPVMLCLPMMFSTTHAAKLHVEGAFGQIVHFGLEGSYLSEMTQKYQ